MAEYLYDSAVPFDSSRIGAAAVYCSDGRFGEQCDRPIFDTIATQGQGVVELLDGLSTG